MDRFYSDTDEGASFGIREIISGMEQRGLATPGEAALARCLALDPELTKIFVATLRSSAGDIAKQTLRDTFTAMQAAQAPTH